MYIHMHCNTYANKRIHFNPQQDTHTYNDKITISSKPAGSAPGFLEITREGTPWEGSPLPPGGRDPPHRRSTPKMIPLPLGGKGPPVDLSRRDLFLDLAMLILRKK
jgi:hypothetical protein